MKRIKVMVVDDSIVMRKLLTDILSQDPDIEVVGTAANGKIAVMKMPQLAPDAITMDVEMPDMDGVAAVREIRKTHPKTPIIMFSTLTERSASSTIRAMEAGATDYVTKPSNTRDITEAMHRLRDELVPKLKSCCAKLLTQRPEAPAPAESKPSSVAPSPLRSRRTERIDMLTIGVSTGGPNALIQIFKTFPEHFPVPITIVQHMPPTFTKMLAERLTSAGPTPFFEAQQDQIIEPGKAYIAPGGLHLEVVRKGVNIQANLHEGPKENSCRPAVDVLFRSVLDVFGGNTLAVVLTGMGADGMRGCELLQNAGAQILAQDEESSVVWGMPGHVARAGLADAVVPLEQMTTEIVRRVQKSRMPAAASSAR